MNTRNLCLATLVATLAACSTTPVPNSALEQARARLQAAQSDPRVATLASQELKSAGDALRLADKTWTDGGERSTVDHLAYMAGQRVTIAQETAASLTSQAVTAGAAAERDKMRLAVRTSEADTAQQQLAASQQTNALKTAELAAAEAAALRDKARVDRRDARVSDLESQLKELNAKKTERGLVVTLGDVLFDSGKSQLQAEGARNMSKLAEVFKRNPERTASVEGYTDSIGSSASNQALSGQRAGAVVSALVNLGVSAGRLNAQAFGEDRPVASNDTASGRQMNRRVEIVFAPQGNETTVK
jgi:outer membrane protein OmpA-like peptidoglycan-associated protein